MPKKEPQESFETTKYSSEEDVYQKYRLIQQIVEDKVQEQPNIACRAVLCGNMLKLFYHAYEMHLPVRIKDVQSSAKSYLDDMVKHVKKEFKSRSGKVLDIKEKKDLANYTVEKASLNERYYYVQWRCFEIS